MNLETALSPALTTFGVIAVAFFGYLTNKQSKKTEAVEKSQTSTRERIAEMQSRIDMLEAELIKERKERERQARIQADYIHSLRRHIVDGVGPPPPPYPADLHA